MDKFVTKRNDLLAEQVIKNLKSRQMEGHYVQTKEEALALALELIPERSSISWGGSMSIRQLVFLKHFIKEIIKCWTEICVRHRRKKQR